jgi:hypothetical protein
MKLYAAYDKINEIMIVPYYNEHPEMRPTRNDEEESVMRDDVTYGK